MLSDSPISLHETQSRRQCGAASTSIRRKTLTLPVANDLRKVCNGVHDDAHTATEGCACSSHVFSSVSASVNACKSSSAVTAPPHSLLPLSLLPKSLTSSSSSSISPQFSLNDCEKFEVIRSMCNGQSGVADDDEDISGVSACVCESYLVRQKETGQLFIFKPQNGEPWKKPKAHHRRLSSEDSSSVLVETATLESEEECEDCEETVVEMDENGEESKAQLLKTPELSITSATSHDDSPSTSPSSSTGSADSSDSSRPIAKCESFSSLSPLPSVASSSISSSQEIRIPLKHGVEYGDCAVKELAAYVIDHGHFANVPPTVLTFVKVRNQQGKGSTSQDSTSEKVQEEEQDEETKKHAKECNSKFSSEMRFGSLQRFCENDGSADDFGPSLFPADEVHKIGILDIRLLNLDRHLGNLLVRRTESHGYTLIPIDHGYTLPAYNNLSDVHFEWTSWWRQCRQPFNKHTLKYIQSLNPLADALRLRQLGIRDESLVSLVFASLLLKRAAVHGCNLETIANMCQRQERNLPSTLETIIQTVIRRMKRGALRRRQLHRRTNSHSQPSSPPQNSKKESESQVHINVIASPNHPLRKVRQSSSTVNLQAVKDMKSNSARRKLEYAQSKANSTDSEHPAHFRSTAASISSSVSASQSLAASSAFWSHCGELLSMMTAEASENAAAALTASKPKEQHKSSAATSDSSPPCSPSLGPSSSTCTLSDSAKRLVDVLEVTLNLIDDYAQKAKSIQDEVEAQEKLKHIRLQRSRTQECEQREVENGVWKEIGAASPKSSGLSRMTHSMTEMDLSQLAKNKNGQIPRQQADVECFNLVKSEAEFGEGSPVCVLSSMAEPALALSPNSSPSNSILQPSSPSSSSSSSLSNCLLPPPVHVLRCVKPPSSPLAAAISLVRRMHSHGSDLLHSRQRISVQV